MVRSLVNMKRKTAELDQAKIRPCVNCETHLLTCTHGRRPNIRTLMETKKDTELRERREKVERDRERKIRKTQSEMQGVSVVDGCKGDEYDLESALLAIEGPSQGSKPKAKKLQTKTKTKGSLKERTKIWSGGDRISNPEEMSANDCSPVISSLLHETCSTQADEDIQMHLKELLFGGKLLKKQMALDSNKVKEMDPEKGIDTGKVLAEQV